jgi:lysophospholipase L1-like esterase
VGSALLFKANLVHDSYLAPDEGLLPSMVWHPLLQAVPKPLASGTGEFKGLHHNSMGLRGPDRSKQSLQDRTVIEVFGGTTVYDSPSSNTEMWTNVLENILGGDKYAVLNRGVGGYSTVENVIQTAFYETPYGESPRCAVYNVGWGDLSSAASPKPDSGYADYHTPFLIDALRSRRLSGPWIFTSPVFFLLAHKIVLAVDTARPVEERASDFKNPPTKEFIEVYTRNIDTISAINRHRGIKTVWLAQPLNIPRDGTGNGVPAPSTGTAWSILRTLNEILERDAKALGDYYIDVPADKFNGADFIDIIHFSPQGSRKFAELVAPDILAACQK